MKKVLFLIPILILSACHSDDLPITQDYLPLQIGNYWNFKSINEPGNNTFVHREVVRISVIDNREYYLLVDSARYGDTIYKDSSYYRVASDGNVFVFRKNQSGLEDNRFRLNGNDGDTWSYQRGDDGKVTISLSVSTLTINNKEIKNCKGYYLDVERWADEENTVTLAPGIGFVKEYSDAWGMGWVVESARINGQNFNF